MSNRQNPFTGRSASILRSLAALLLIITLFLACGVAAFAETNSQIVSLPSNNYTHWRVTTFSGEMPADITKALSQMGYSDYSCYSGAMLEQLQEPRYQGMSSSLSAEALIALEKDGERILVGMLWSEKKWGILDLGGKALLPDREFTIGAMDEDHNSVWYWPIRFTITYPLSDGGSETYGLHINTRQTGEMSLWNARYQLWCVSDYARKDEKGRGIAIVNGDGILRAFDLPYDKFELESCYPAYLPFALEYMDSIADFPTDHAEVKRQAEASVARFEGTDLAVATGGVNLRQYPTMASKSLCRVRTGTLVQVLGEEKGWLEPWYHVRMGQLEGFISGTYLKLWESEDFLRALSTGPLVVARALDACMLRENPESDARGKEFPADTLMHVLADADDGWVYVMVPRGEIGPDLDMQGTGGYVLESEVLQGVYVEARP